MSKMGEFGGFGYIIPEFRVEGDCRGEWKNDCPWPECACAKLKNENMNTIEAKVYPSDENTIKVAPDKEYGGAHRYEFRNCVGFRNGITEYLESGQIVQFVQKNEDGSMTPGLQSEQLVLALIDRQKKLNARFPSVFNEKALAGLEMFLEAQRERVEDRVARGVMGDLKK